MGTRSEEYKKIIKIEYLKCLQDPVYFMKKYCWIQNPIKGKVKFNLYPFQEDTLKQLKDNRFNIINKSRQMGISTLTAAFSLWMILFHKDKNILVIATKQDVAKNLVTKVRVMFENTPSWMKVTDTENNKLSLRLANGSQIKAASSSGDAGRSEALSMLIIDEAAFIEGIEEIWASSQSTLSTGGRAIILSTPKGTGNFFHEMWTNAESGDNDFNTISLKWDLHPERNQDWRDQQTRLLGERLAAQECDCLWGDSMVTVYDTILEKEFKVRLDQLYNDFLD